MRWPVDAALEPTRILVVDADEQRATASARLLAELGEVRIAVSADQALQRLLTGDWSVVVVTRCLPDMDGLELLRAIPFRDPTPIKVLVGESGFDEVIEAMRAGADDYVIEVGGPDELLRRIRIAVDRDRDLRRSRRPSERVLAVGAHPDDIEIGCGGILLRHRDEGHLITIVTLTRGERGGDGEVRRAESRKAASLLSARLVMLDLGDTAVPDGGTTIEALSKIVGDVRPTTIYTHTLADTHQDHRSAHRATVVAARGAPGLYAYQSPSSTVDFCPHVFVSIDEVLERKLELLGPYGSQNSIREYLAPDLIRATARSWGRFGSSDYAEPLEVLRQADLLASRSERALPTAASDVARIDHATL